MTLLMFSLKKGLKIHFLEPKALFGQENRKQQLFSAKINLSVQVICQLDSYQDLEDLS